jgi:hypothetical protein
MAPTFAMVREIDVPAVIAAGGLASASKITANENIAVFNVRKGLLVLDVICEILEAGTASATIDIGDDTDVEGFDAAVALDAAAGTLTRSDNAADAYNMQLAGGKLYGATDTIDVLFNTDVTTGRFKLTAICIDTSTPNVV